MSRFWWFCNTTGEHVLNYRGSRLLNGASPGWFDCSILFNDLWVLLWDSRKSAPWALVRTAYVFICKYKYIYINRTQNTGLTLFMSCQDTHSRWDPSHPYGLSRTNPCPPVVMSSVGWIHLQWCTIIFHLQENIEKPSINGGLSI